VVLARRAIHQTTPLFIGESDFKETDQQELSHLVDTSPTGLEPRGFYLPGKVMCTIATLIYKINIWNASTFLN